MKINDRVKRGLFSQKKSKTKKRIQKSIKDRFIPKKISKINYDIPERNSQTNFYNNFEDNSKNNYNLILLDTLIHSKTSKKSYKTKTHKILEFSDKKKNPKSSIEYILQNDLSFQKKKNDKYLFNKKELKILEAPSLKNSFYFNILDINTENLLSVSLSNNLYTYDQSKNETNLINSLKENDVYSSLKFQKKNKEILATGTNNGFFELFDVYSNTVLRKYKKDSGRISAIDWSGQLVANGSKFGKIILRDIRQKENSVNKLFSHTQEVCSLRFSPFNQNLLLSGGNDDKAFLYDLRKMKDIFKIEEHKAAIKAISWHCTKPNIFITGGGSVDRKICIWDSNKLSLVKKLKKNSQICNLGYTKDGLIIASQGFPLNNLEILDPNTLETLEEFKGHSERILYMALNHTLDMAITGSPDETIRFWNIKNLYLKQDSLWKEEKNPNFFGLNLR